jgi:hypothetical protein
MSAKTDLFLMVRVQISSAPIVRNSFPHKVEQKNLFVLEAFVSSPATKYLPSLGVPFFPRVRQN